MENNNLKLADYETIVNRLSELYKTDKITVATICDDVLDRSGALLGKVRDRYFKNKHIE